MKCLIVLLSLIPAIVFSQTKADYEHAMAMFKKFYNTGHGDSINAMFGHDWDQVKEKRPMWTNEQCASMLKEYGTLKYYKFIGIDTDDPSKVYVFKTVFSKAGKKTTSLTLDKDNGLGTFRFITSSDGITKLLKKAR